MYLAITLILVFGLLLALFSWLGRKPYVHKNVPQDELGKFLKILLDSGFNGGFVIINAPGDHRFIQFSKYLTAKGVRGIQFDFPLANWSRELYPALKKVLKSARIEFEVQEVSGKAGEVAEFIVVDLKKNLAEAVLLTRICLLEVFGLEEAIPVQLYYRHVDYQYRVIGG